MNDAQTSLIEAKERSVLLLERFVKESSDINARRHLQRVLDCEKTHLLFQTAAGFEVSPARCNSRWCERCAHNRAREMSTWLNVQFSNLWITRSKMQDDKLVEFRERVQKSDLRHFVFTIRSIPYFKLRASLDRFRVAIRQITKLLQQDDSVYLWKIEIVFKRSCVHPHIHLAVNKFIDVNYLHEFWRRNIKPFDSKIKFATKVKCSMFEFCKYTTKPSSWENINYSYFQFVWFAFQRRRVIGCSRHITLLPKTHILGWKLLGSLERIMTDEKSDFQGIAAQIYYDLKNKEKTKFFPS